MHEYQYSRRVLAEPLHNDLTAAFGEIYSGYRVNDAGFTVFLTEERPAIDVNAIVEAQDIAILSADKTSVDPGDDVTVTVWLPYTDQIEARISIEGLNTSMKTLDESKRASWVIAAAASLDGSLTIGVPDHPHDVLEIEVNNGIA